MDIALCYESVLPARGGAETYISDLSRRLVADGHAVRLYACRWDAAALPSSMTFRQLPDPGKPRFLRPWRFGRACERALAEDQPEVSLGFDKTWGQDVLYPQGGLHAASQTYNLAKAGDPFARAAAWLGKRLDPAYHSFRRLEAKQYLGVQRPIVVVNSRMVQRHFWQFYGIPPGDLRVLPSAVNPDRFHADDRPRRRAECRERWGLDAGATVGVFLAMNYRLKGLAPLLNAVALLPPAAKFQLLVAGHPDYACYAKQTARLGIEKRVRFAGHCPEPRDAYFAGDFLIHPTFYDPCSLVVLEALACGLPVITTQANGASELLPTGAGAVIADPHDSARLAAEIAALLDGPRRTAAARAARAAGQRWTFEEHYQGLLTILTEAAARRRATG